MNKSGNQNSAENLSWGNLVNSGLVASERGTGDKMNEQAKTPVLSRDEMNLSEFPLTILSTRGNSNIKTLEFSDKIRNKNGEMINRSWIITGADKFGLPTASDDEVLLGLLKLTVDQQFDSRKVCFSRYELLKNLRWSTEGRNYSRLQKALDRLSGVRIKATNAFFDNELKSHSTKNFGIIDGYELNDGRDNDRPSFFLWSEVIFKSFQSGFIKKLDLDFYLNLKSAVSKRIYRYLDKHFWYKSKVQVNFFIFAHEKVGVSRTYQYVSSIRQQIDPALDELKNCGFIKDYSYQGQGSATEIIIFAASGQPRVSAPKQHAVLDQPEVAQTEKIKQPEKFINSQDPLQVLKGSVLTQLEERGITAPQARRLLESLPEELEVFQKIGKIISHYDYLLSTSSKLVSRNPVGFLFKAIQYPDRFVLPEESRQQAAAKPAVKQQNLFAEDKNSRQLESFKARYLAFRKQEILRIKAECEPELVTKLTSEVEKALSKLKTLISENNFRDAVEHGVQEKLAKLFALPDFDEWKKGVK